MPKDFDLRWKSDFRLIFLPEINVPNMKPVLFRIYVPKSNCSEHTNSPIGYLNPWNPRLTAIRFKPLLYTTDVVVLKSYKYIVYSIRFTSRIYVMWKSHVMLCHHCLKFLKYVAWLSSKIYSKILLTQDKNAINLSVEIHFLNDFLMPQNKLCG